MKPEDIAAVIEGITPKLQEVRGAVEALQQRIVTLEQERTTETLASRERLAHLEQAGRSMSALGDLVGGLRERLAIVEARGPMPGPPGPPGPGIRDVVVGPDGVQAELEDGRRVDLPVPYHAGVYQAHKSYKAGTLVTWEGSTWLCSEATSSRPSDIARAWRLVVKRGRDGRDLTAGKAG